MPELTTDWVAQVVECWTVCGRLTVQTPDRNIQGLEITEKNDLSLVQHPQMLRNLSLLR